MLHRRERLSLQVWAPLATVPFTVRPDGGSVVAARTGRAFGLPGHRPLLRHRVKSAVLAGAALLGGALAPALTQTTAHAATVASLKQEAAAIAVRLNSAYTRLSILDEEYNNAVIRVSEVKHAISLDTAAVTATKAKLGQDQAQLRKVAIDDYVSGGAGKPASGTPPSGALRPPGRAGGRQSESTARAPPQVRRYRERVPAQCGVGLPRAE